MLMSDITRDARGVDRCNRMRNQAIPNVTGDPAQGYRNIIAVCNAAIVQRVSDGVKGCPHCDKEPAVGNVKPRTINSNDVALTAKELQECKVIDDAIAAKIALKNGTLTNVAPEGTFIDTPAVEAKMSEIKKDVVILEIKLDDLKASPDICAFLVQKVIDGMDTLPVANYGESRKLDQIRLGLTKLLEA